MGKQVELEGEGDAGIEKEMGDRGVERGSPLISGRSERTRKETESSKEDCKQGMHSIPNSTNASRRDRRREKEKSSRLSETEMEREDDRVRERKRRRKEEKRKRMKMK